MTLKSDAETFLKTTIKTDLKTMFITAFDVVFIMILCFATLLSTMLMRGSVIAGAEASAGLKYSFGASSFLLTIASLGAYLFYILPHSNKELKIMVEELYQDETASH